MLIWSCALHCEAKPVIDYYRLQKAATSSPFDLYRNDSMTCVVSGIGKIASAVAIASTAEKFREEGSLAWINLGVAGAADSNLGECHLINKSVDQDTEQTFYPAIIGKSAMPTRTCITSSTVVSDYHPDHLHDMEASGYFQTALYYSSAELVHSIKVVSYNRQQSTGKNRQQTSQLIADNMPGISQQANVIESLNRELNSHQIKHDVLDDFLSLAHFSTTRQHQLGRALGYLLNRGFEHRRLLDTCRGQSAEQIIRQLQQLGEVNSRNL